MSRPYDATTRTAAAERKRGDIVEAARALLREGSAEGFSLDAVAKRAGVTRVTVYNQFGSRNGLLEAVFDATARAGGLDRIPEVMMSPDMATALDRLVEVFCGLWSTDPAIGQVVRAAAADPELSAAVEARNARRRQIITVLMARFGDGIAKPNEFAALALTLTSYPTWATLNQELQDAGRTRDALKRTMRALLGIA